jgi:uncharacterized protein (DUF1800 family)
MRSSLRRSSIRRSSSARSIAAKLALSLLCFSLVVLVLICVPQLLADKKDQAAGSAASEQKRAVHALNRLTFGPRPGDVQQVMAMGVDRWIDLQLHPEKINDSAVDARLAPLRTLRMGSHEIVEEFPDPPMIQQVMNGKRSMPSDPARRAIYQVQLARLEEKQERKEEERKEVAAAATSTQSTPMQKGKEETSASDPPASAGSDGGAKTAEELAAAAAVRSDALPATASDNNLASAMSSSNNDSSAAESASSASAGEMSGNSRAESKPTAMDEAEARAREDRLYTDLEIQGLIDLPPDQRYKKVMSMSIPEQVAFADSLRGGKGQEFLVGLDPKQREVLMAMNNPMNVVVDELVQAKLLRAIYSDRQLEEVMTDFWVNHFNVFSGKGADRIFITDYEQQVIRPRALGKFEDLLVATAKSPAMLFYLDNWMSVGPNSMQALGIPDHPRPYGPYSYPGQNPNRNKKKPSGLNENYGRELLELHTLSVNGGYSQRDVTEAAKVFTGWTIEKPYEGGTFKFDERMHEPGPKFVLGHRIKPKGEDEGMEVLHMLATSPQTAHFISLKLAQRFVSDDPPAVLVDRMAKTFLKKKGDIREVLSTLFHSPEFWAEGTYRAKVKTPFEFVVSSVRATGGDVEWAMPLANQLNKMGMPLYGAQPPTGYSMKAETWVSSGALLNRMNFALALTAGKIRGVKVDVAQLVGSSAPSADPAALSNLEAKLLASDVSQQTHDSIVAQTDSAKNAPAPQPDQKMDQKQDQNPNQKNSKPADAAHPPEASMMAGLLLGSPEFQRR